MGDGGGRVDEWMGGKAGEEVTEDMSSSERRRFAPREVKKAEMLVSCLQEVAQEYGRIKSLPVSSVIKKELRR